MAKFLIATVLALCHMPIPFAIGRNWHRQEKVCSPSPVLKSLHKQGVQGMPDIVLVRAYGGEPLAREAVGRGKGVIYVRAIRANSPELEGFPPPIGVPHTDVFAYNDALFEKLRSRWKAGIGIKDGEWGALWQEPIAEQIPSGLS